MMTCPHLIAGDFDCERELGCGTAYYRGARNRRKPGRSNEPMAFHPDPWGEGGSGRADGGWAWAWISVVEPPWGTETGAVAMGSRLAQRRRWRHRWLVARGDDLRVTFG